MPLVTLSIFGRIIERIRNFIKVCDSVVLIRYTHSLRNMTDVWMLEGGYGIGPYVEVYSAKGVIVVGLDFAQNTLNHI